MTEKLLLIACYGVIYAAFNAWTEKSIYGIALKKYLVEWKTDSFLHLVLCSGSVFILSCCAILALGLTFKVLGI